jgi:hypothetical protein
MLWLLGILQIQAPQSIDNELGIGGKNVFPEVLHFA